MSLYDFQGKTIHFVQYSGSLWSGGRCVGKPIEPVNSGTKIPPSDRLLNFDLVAGEDVYVVLDNYGDEILCGKIRDRLFSGLDDFTLAIDEKTGQIYVVEFAETGKEENTAYLFSLEGYRVPEKYLARINELKSFKRPYYISISEMGLIDFIDQEIGFSQLEEFVLIDLSFNDTRIQVVKDGYRTVSGWVDLAD